MASKMTESKIYENEIEILLDRHYTRTMVLYMSFDKFLLAVETCDISQADKSIIRVSSFSKFSEGYKYLMFSRQV